MRILIDADGCPVVRLTVQIAKECQIDCIIVCDTAHYFDIEGAQTITVDKGSDSADMKLVNMIKAGDIAVTQDYGLAAMCLARGGFAINQNGFEYTDDNIARLLETRAIAKKIRRSGGRLKGPKKRTEQDDAQFEQSLKALIERIINA